MGEDKIGVPCTGVERSRRPEEDVVMYWRGGGGEFGGVINWMRGEIWSVLYKKRVSCTG